MCMMDWRIGRLVRTEQTDGTGVLSTVTLTPNKQRVGVLVTSQTPIAAAAGAEIRVAIDGATGFRIPSENLPYMLSLTTHGDIPTRGFVIEDPGITVSISVFSFFMPEEYLTAGLEEFRSKYRI